MHHVQHQEFTSPAKQVNIIIHSMYRIRIHLLKSLHAIYGNTMYYHTGSEIIYNTPTYRAVNTNFNTQSNPIALSPATYMYTYTPGFFQGKPPWNLISL